MNRLMELYLRRRTALVPEVEIKEINPLQKDFSLISTFIRNAECYNYTFSPEAITYLASLDDDKFIEVSEDMIEIFKKFVGEGDYMTPLYPNFPKQVMELDEATLYYNALMHWASCGEVIPEFVDEEGNELPIFINTNKLTKIDLGTKEDYLSVFTNLIGGKGILSDTDKEDIIFFVKSEPTIVDYMPESIPIKENLSAITTLFIQEFGYNSEIVKSLSNYYKTATDVLRLATGLSIGALNAVSLASDVKYKSFSRPERRFLLNLLEKCGPIEEDMSRYSVKWIRLGEKLHPGEYKNLVKVNKAFKKIRNNNKGIITFNSKVQKAYENKDTDKLITLLSSRPGEFARKLATVIRMDAKNGDKIVDAFEKVADKVATPTLLELTNHFQTVSSEEQSDRVFFPKGNLSKAYSIENKLTPIDKDLADRVTTVCREAFVRNMQEKPSLGNVYIDEGLKNFIIPMKSRTASKQLKFVARGTRFHISDKTKWLVPFVYWKEPRGERVDLDLSVVLYDKDFKKLQEITYYNLVSKEYGCVHSGDEQAAPKGAIECVSMDLDKMISKEVNYIAVCINSYTATPFCNLPECYVGLMEKEVEFSGKAFDPSTVKQKSDLVTKAETSMACLIDLENKDMVWSDLELINSYSISFNPNNVATHSVGILNTMKYLLSMNKPTVYDMAVLNAKARGQEVVEEQYLADTIFSTEQVDTDALLAQRQEIRKKEEEKQIMEQAQKILEKQEELPEEERKSLEEIVEQLTNELEEEKAKNPLPKEEIACITPYDVDVIVSQFI